MLLDRKDVYKRQVEWVAEEAVYEPVVEALMLNATGNQGVSFISVGRVVSQID